MRIVTLSNEEIDHALTAAMQATVNALNRQGLITAEEATEWNKTHVCLRVDSRGVWDKIRSFCGLKTDDAVCSPQIFQVK